MTSEMQYRCLCCNQPVTQPGKAPKDMAKAWESLKLLGYTREQLLDEHLANLDYTAPGFTDWLREHPE